MTRYRAAGGKTVAAPPALALPVNGGIADAVGFPYRFDAAAGQYAHPAGLTIAAPDATIARYILGLGYVPLDLRLALTEAGRGEIASRAQSLAAQGRTKESKAVDAQFRKAWSRADAKPLAL